MDPDVHVLSYNVGLTNDQVDPNAQGSKSIFYKFTTQLKDVIHRMFTRGADTPAADTHALDARSAGADTPSTPAHVVFLCELGSQKKERGSMLSSRGGQTTRFHCTTIILNVDSATLRAASIPTSVLSWRWLSQMRIDTKCGPAPLMQQSTTRGGSLPPTRTTSSKRSQIVTVELQ